MTLVQRYLARLLAKLPDGTAFRRDILGYIARLFAAFAQEFARIDARATSVLAEAPPWLSVELLPDWERVLGLPATGSVSDRQLAVGAKILDQGGCSIDYMKSLATLLGYDIEITEYLPWRCGISSVADPLVSDAWMATWTVTYMSALNDALLEATLIAARPDHTVVAFERHFYPTIDGNYLSIDGNRVFI